MHLNVTQTECKRCGQCCRNGGPALHLEDRELVVAGRLLPAHLVTLRKGEPAWDPKNGEIIFLEKELIKIRGIGKIGACMFFDKEGRKCSIYQWRPLECKLLKCWDTRELESVYMTNLLGRRHLIPQGSTLSNLIEKHEETFDVTRVCSEMVKRYGEGQATDIRLDELIRRDALFRQNVMDNFQLHEEDLDFFFGRPMAEVIASMASRLEKSLNSKKNE